MAAANRRLVRRSVASDHNDQRLRPASVLVMASATTPWKRAWEGQRWLKMWDSFQSAASGAAAVIRVGRVSRPRPASPPIALEAAPIMVLLSDRRQVRDPWVSFTCGGTADMIAVTPTRHRVPKFGSNQQAGGANSTLAVRHGGPAGQA